DRLVPDIRRMTDEIGHMSDGLRGEHVVPGPAGAPTRGGAAILPMGRNFYSLDPDSIPTHTAWEIGKRMADQMIERYVAEKGTYPREVGFVIWATDTMKTYGDDVAYILWLLGVRPVWARTGGQVVDLETVPLSELGRPRVDVTVNITGLFRDTFPNLIDLIDQAVNIVADLDESDEDNALAANLRKDVIEGIVAGLTPDEARRRNAVRIFGAPPGGYGAGVSKAIEASSWETVEDLANVYLDWCSNGYSRGHFGEKMKDEFVKRFGGVEVTIKNMPDREIDLLDCDDVYQYLGGMNAFVRAYGKHRDTFSTYMGDDSDPKKSKLRSTQQELRYVFRSKVLNPKFINGLKEHGYRGAGDMASITEFTMAWGATSDIAEDWMYEGLSDKFLFDRDTQEWMLDVNPYAMMSIINRLQEAIERGLWDATDEYKDRLKELYMKVEERIEEATDR
ncbi:MAG: cobaltochelatase subunit CobN, partial [Candidatus Methanomethylophilaceae archaeon]|nr:cobaltochelatase subunit CobN [Candidatus Methanomethylophilaceae archaeon]